MMWLALIFYMLEEGVRQMGLLWNKDWDLIFINRVIWIMIYTLVAILIYSII